MSDPAGGPNNHAPAPADGRRRIRFLGTGTSTGVPTLGCDCSVCRSEDPRNRRTRPSVLLEFPAGSLLVDTTPDMRTQLLRERVPFAHAIAFTHDHADHLFGLDDARLFCRYTGGSVPVLCEEFTERSIRRVFHYAAFESDGEPPPPHVVGVPRLKFRRVRPGEPFEILGQTVLPVRLDHGRSPTLGFRVDGLAYCTDVKTIPDESWPLLENLDVLVIDALRFDPHPTHMSLDEAMRAIERLAPERAYLTHISHSFDHAALEAALPPFVRLAYDGLALEF